MPTVIAVLSDAGTAAASSVRRRVHATMANSTAATSEMASASCHARPIEATTVYVKNALMPMPGVRMIGASA